MNNLHECSLFSDSEKTKNATESDKSPFVLSSFWYNTINYCFITTKIKSLKSVYVTFTERQSVLWLFSMLD